ncbi:MAG TPA: hypothetical protein VIX82_01610 [Solirubrobacteraceae bacterium]
MRLLAPERPCDELLSALPQVSAVEHHGPELIITGSEDLLSAVVLATLPRRRAAARARRLDDRVQRDRGAAVPLGISHRADAQAGVTDPVVAHDDRCTDDW